MLPTHPPNIILAAAKLNSKPSFITTSNPHRDKANATELFKAIWKYIDKAIKEIKSHKSDEGIKS